MAFFQSIMPDQEPFDMGTDENGRARVVFNVRCVKTPSDTFEEELVKLLETALVGTFGTNIFASSMAAVPIGDGPYLTIITTGGTAPMYNQNTSTPAHQRPSAQLVARAGSYPAARTMARAAYDALSKVRNVTVNP